MDVHFFLYTTWRISFFRLGRATFPISRMKINKKTTYPFLFIVIVIIFFLIDYSRSVTENIV